MGRFGERVADAFIKPVRVGPVQAEAQAEMSVMMRRCPYFCVSHEQATYPLTPLVCMDHKPADLGKGRGRRK